MWAEQLGGQEPLWTHPDEKRTFEEPFGWVFLVILSISVQKWGPWVGCDLKIRFIIPYPFFGAIINVSLVV